MEKTEEGGEQWVSLPWVWLFAWCDFKSCSKKRQIIFKEWLQTSRVQNMSNGGQNANQLKSREGRRSAENHRPSRLCERERQTAWRLYLLVELLEFLQLLSLRFLQLLQLFRLLHGQLRNQNMNVNILIFSMIQLHAHQWELLHLRSFNRCFYLKWGTSQCTMSQLQQTLN